MTVRNNPGQKEPPTRSYARHIVIILLVKAVLFTGIWYFFFRNPVELSDSQNFQKIFFKKPKDTQKS